MESSGQIAKWGFGMAPISYRMRRRYDDAVQTTIDVVERNLHDEEVALNDISELKGMFNRCLRQDQWDWFSVYTELGEPDHRTMRRIVAELKPLRRAISTGASEDVGRLVNSLIDRNLLHYLHAYQNGLGEQSDPSGAGWVYILSTREQPDVLKIGMTTRTVAERVKEINSASGLLIPFAARKVYRVCMALKAEQSIHQRLAGFRIRQDREFFRMPFQEASALIEEYVESERLRQRCRGQIAWFDPDKGFGFISVDGQNEEVFFHASQVKAEAAAELRPGIVCEFDPGRSPKGSCALNVDVLSGAAS